MVDTVFSLSGMLAGVGWIGLILLPRRGIAIVAARLVIPGMIGIVYVTFFVLFFDSIPEGGGFGSLAAVATLFTVEELLLCGWIHYLAFDLFVGSWEVEDAQTRGIIGYTKMLYDSPDLWTTIIPLRDGVGVSLKL